MHVVRLVTCLVAVVWLEVQLISWHCNGNMIYWGIRYANMFLQKKNSFTASNLSELTKEKKSFVGQHAANLLGSIYFNDPRPSNHSIVVVDPTLM